LWHDVSYLTRPNIRSILGVVTGTTARAAERRQYVLDAARRCFLANGFHATSMKDILREAQMSPGNLYRYFPSKDALVLAIVEATLAEITSPLAPAADGEPLPLAETLHEVLRRFERLDTGAPRLAIQIWGEALRDPALAALLATALERVKAGFVPLVEEQRGRGSIPVDASAEHVATVLVGTVHGFIVQNCLLGVDAATYIDGLQALSTSGRASGDD
jgi:AcrR family transcriptional regulator